VNRKLRMGMVGGGPGGFIGEIHRKAANLTGEIELVCGAFSSSPQKSQEMGKLLFLDPKRVYASYEEMIKTESTLPRGERMDFVSIVTPNYLHYPVAKLALEHGFPVVSDKPLTIKYNEAKELKELAEAKALPFAVTYVYSGYPMAREARKRILRGDLGKIKRIIVSYVQGGLARPRKRKIWRLEPEKGGIAGSIGDIGTHAEHIARYFTGLKIGELYADLRISAKGRKIYDDGDILVHFENGVMGVITLSQIASGEENNLTISVYGEKGGLIWKQQEPNSLIVKWNNAPTQIIRTGRNAPELEREALKAAFLPMGHPEGFIEAFTNIYRGFACRLKKIIFKENIDCNELDYPDIQDGVLGMAFVEAALKSSEEHRWVSPGEL